VFSRPPDRFGWWRADPDDAFRAGSASIHAGWIEAAGSTEKGDMSFQAYLDNIEAKTGKTPNEFVAMAREKGFDAPNTKAGTIVEWLKEDYGLGRGHAMALVHVIRNGAEISDKHVGTAGTHSDPSTTLRLDGTKS